MQNNILKVGDILRPRNAYEIEKDSSFQEITIIKIFRNFAVSHTGHNLINSPLSDGSFKVTDKSLGKFSTFPTCWIVCDAAYFQAKEKALKLLTLRTYLKGLLERILKKADSIESAEKIIEKAALIYKELSD